MQKRLLVVDDNSMNRELFCEILEDEYQIEQAANGKEALDILNERQQEIDLILLDLLMPVMDGYEFLERWGEEQSRADIPVIVITQVDSEDEEVRALTLGASDFLIKPYNPRIIKQRIANLIKLRDTARIMQKVERDSLTRVYTKESFYQKAQEIIEKNPKGEFDIICSDIENFKLVNDIFGTQTGDELLCFFATIWAGRLKNRGICGRMGADTFAAILPSEHTYTAEDFNEITEELNEYPINIHLYVRYGIFHVKDSQVPVNLMCDRALFASKSIKGRYGKCFVYYDESFRERLLNRQFITDSMEKAIREKQFQVYLQPKFNLTNNKIVGAEALVRWAHPEKGLISPGEFIPLFENNGFITTMDKYVWDVTCSVIRRMIDKGNKIVPISVNVSRVDIYEPELINIIMQILDKYNLKPQNLHLEITETAYTENPQQIISVAGKLKEMGFVIEMDDFGSGYSSLNMLSELPVDTLKLDMKFIQSELKRGKAKNIINFIINLAKWMDLSVIAEGVENQEQVDFLKEMQCGYAQGYYFAKPMPIDDFEKLLKDSPIE